ncbi:MAG: DUF1893 domain-containing protein [Sphaerochaetaceae bacterium]|nr:DUF1893 domain-containing protein [Sphaerochaetaceae bacterium]
MPTGVSLAVYQGTTRVFTSGGKWLHPLFELEQFLKESRLDPRTLSLHDTAAGLAAAALMARMGIQKVHVNLISELALQCYSRYRIDISWERKVDRLACKTEDILNHGMSLDEIYATLRRRAKLVQGIPLSVSDVSAGYGNHLVFEHVSFFVEGGGRLILRGENGCGKSTLLKCILGQQPVWNGAIKVGDKLASVVSSRQNSEVQAGTIAYIKQDHEKQQFPVSVQEVVAMGLLADLTAEERNWRLDISMRRTGCRDLADRNYFTLSGGERQRVAIARCLCQHAGLFLLDEPTTFLDKESRDTLVSILKGLSVDEMPTMVLVTHDQSLVDALGWPEYSMEHPHD